MIQSESLFISVRGLRYHVRSWGEREAPKIFLLHGWMDVSASFQFVVDALRGRWNVLAPDWRGFGETEWSGTDCYWYADYLADLDQILQCLQPDAPVNLVGHSMGGNIGCIYAGSRPERIARFVNLEGLGMRDSDPNDAPKRFARWIEELGREQLLRRYASFDELAQRLARDNPRLRPDRAAFLARHWGMQTQDGQVALRGDPVHKRINPILYRSAEVAACLRAISAPVMWVQGEHTDMLSKFRIPKDEIEARIGDLRDCQTMVIPDAGHMLHHDAPERVAEIIENFFV